MGQRQYFSAQTRTRACVISRCGATVCAWGGGGGGGGGAASLWSFVLLYNGRVASGMVASAGVLATLPFKRGARAYLTFVCLGTKRKQHPWDSVFTARCSSFIYY